MSEIIGLIFTFAPILLILWLANLAEARRQPRETLLQPTTGSTEPYELVAQPGVGKSHDDQGLAVLAYLLLGLLYGLAITAGLSIQLVAVFVDRQPGALDAFGLGGEGAPQFASFGLLGLGLWLPSLIGILLLLPVVRRMCARFMPAFNAESPVHAVALSLSMLVVGNLLFTLGVGLDNLANIIAAENSAGESGGVSTLGLWMQQILTAVMAMIGVGWLTRRSGGQTLQRLGIVSPSPRQVAIGVGLGLAMVPVIMLLGYVSTLFGVGEDPSVENLTQELIGPLFRSPLGIITLGVAAALGEETLFRGAALPVFGLFLTSLLFALVHSNYGITFSTLVVFILGVVLAIVRTRHNTSTAMILHAVYNMTLGLLAYLSLSFLDV